MLRATCGAATDDIGFMASNGFGQLVGLGGSSVPAPQCSCQFDEQLRTLRS